MIRTSSLTAAVIVAAGTAQAAAVLRESKTIEIAAPPAKVWSIVQNFSDLTWVPAVKASTATDGNTVGSIRTLDLGGPKLIERLKSYSAPKRTYSYVITDDPANIKTLPVTAYTSTIVLHPSAKGTLVSWRGAFKRADLSATPAAGMDDKTATGAVSGVYISGLAALKTKAEGG